MARNTRTTPVTSAPRGGGTSGEGGVPLNHAALARAAQDLLGLVDARMRTILAARFGLDTGKPQTLQAIGNAQKITRERVRQIEHAGLTLLRRPETVIPDAACAARAALLAQLEQLGRAAREDDLLASLGLSSEIERARLRFLLVSLPSVTEAQETQRTVAHWAFADARPSLPDHPAVETVLEVAERVLAEARSVVPDAEYLTRVSAAVGGSVSPTALRSLLGISKKLARSPFGEWGLRGWPEVSPRGVADKAAIVLKRHGKPLHFRAVAEAINAARFGGRPAHPQTVHNELIRDGRFVLVGRGLYGLKEWGLESGTVAEVAVRILVRAGRPLPRRELVAAVLKERLVKRNTVLLALQDRSLFAARPDGMVALAGESPPAGQAPTGR